jgi:hypothetical protein
MKPPALLTPLDFADHIDAEWLTISFDAAKAADFKGWADVYAQALSEGRLRR